MLTVIQREMLDFIRVYQKEQNGVSPSLSEMVEGLGYSSKSSAHRTLRQLEDRGAIHRLRNRERAIRIVDGGPMLAWAVGPGKRRRRYRLVSHG